MLFYNFLEKILRKMLYINNNWLYNKTEISYCALWQCRAVGQHLAALPVRYKCMLQEETT